MLKSMSTWDGDPIEGGKARGQGARTPRPASETIGLTLMSVAALALGLYLSGVLLVAVGLSATGVGAAGAPLLFVAPLPTVIALVLVVLMWRRPV